MMRADSGWIDEFRVRYADWWPEAQPMIERHDPATRPGRLAAGQRHLATAGALFGAIEA